MHEMTEPPKGFSTSQQQPLAGDENEEHASQRVHASKWRVKTGIHKVHGA